MPELFLLRDVADIVEECAIPSITTSPHAANMHIQKLKVRPKKSADSLFILGYPDHLSGAAVSLCAPELATMLGCWAAKNDMTTTGTCAETAKALYDCMRTTVGVFNHRWFRL